jgi:hypothetical protein
MLSERVILTILYRACWAQYLFSHIFERVFQVVCVFFKFQVYRLSEILSEQRAATKENVERKQARTEMEREESDEEASDDDGNQVTILT